MCSICFHHATEAFCDHTFAYSIAVLPEKHFATTIHTPFCISQGLPWEGTTLCPLGYLQTSTPSAYLFNYETFVSSEAVTAWAQRHADLLLLGLARVLPTINGVWAVEQPLLQHLAQATACVPQKVDAILKILCTGSQSFICFPVSLLDPSKNNLVSMHNVWHPSFSHTSFLLHTSPLPLCTVPHKTKVLWGSCIGCASQRNTSITQLLFQGLWQLIMLWFDFELDF